MATTFVEGSPDPFWSEQEEREMREEIERGIEIAPRLGQSALRKILFDPRLEFESPTAIRSDSYRSINHN